MIERGIVEFRLYLFHCYFEINVLIAEGVCDDNLTVNLECEC